MLHEHNYIKISGVDGNPRLEFGIIREHAESRVVQELFLGNLRLLIVSAAVAAFSGMVAMLAVWLSLRHDAKRQTLCCYIFAALPFIVAAAAFMLFSANVPYDDDFNSIVSYLAHPWPERLKHLIDYNWEHRVGLSNLCAEMMVAVTGRVDFQWLAALGLSFAVAVCILFWRCLKVHGEEGCFVAAAMLWLFMAVLSDYFFWSMATIQNNGCLLFVLLSLTILRSNWPTRRMGFALAILLAVVSTYTSGNGMILWPVMAGLMLMRRDCHRSIAEWCIFVAVAVASILFYFHTPWVSQNAAGESFSIVRALAYFFTFAGAWTCLPGVSLVAGILACCMLVYLLFKVDKVKNPEILFFAGYIVAVMSAGALLRSKDILYALPPRHTELSFALLACLLILAFDEFNIAPNFKKWGVSALCGYVVCVNVFSFGFFGIIWRDRVEIDRRNLLMRPITHEALTCIHGPWHDNAIDNLRKLETKGIYNSLWTLKKGETPPSGPIDPGDFWTPGRHVGK